MSRTHQSNAVLPVKPMPDFPQVIPNSYYNTNWKPIINTYRPQVPSSEAYHHAVPPLGSFNGPPSTRFSRSTSSLLAQVPTHNYRPPVQYILAAYADQSSPFTRRWRGRGKDPIVPYSRFSHPTPAAALPPLLMDFQPLVAHRPFNNSLPILIL